MLMTTGQIAAALILVSFATVAGADTLPPPDHDDDIPGNDTMRAQPAVGVALGSLFVRFERTPLANIVKRVPGARVGHRGDAGESQYYVCLTNHLKKPRDLAF